MKWFVVFAIVVTTGCFSAMRMGSGGAFEFEQGGMFPTSLTEAATAECIHTQNMRPDGDVRRCSMYGYGGYGYGSSYGGYYGYGMMPRVDPDYYYPSYGYAPYSYGQSEEQMRRRVEQEIRPELDRLGQAVQGIAEQMERINGGTP